MRLTAALGLWWPEAYGGSASCSDVPRLLLGIARSAGGHDEALLGYCQGFCLGLPRLMCARCMPRPLLRGLSHAESTRGMTRLLSFSPFELFDGVPVSTHHHKTNRSKI
jgi:hypothetical protein